MNRSMLLAPTALEGRVALVTGCGRPDGIGAAVARHLASAGAAVVLNDLQTPTPVEVPESQHRGDDGVESIADALRATGARVATVIGDVRSEDVCTELVARCHEVFGSCDIVVNNAAAGHGLDRGDITDVPSEAFDTQIAVNLRGSFLVARAAVPGMRARRFGRIVNVSSLAALRGVRQRAAYSASKAGLLGLTYSLAADVAQDGITVNAVCPGVILTARNLTSIPRPGDPALPANPRAWSPMLRAGTPDDIAAAVSYFASELAGFVTGQVLAVDGGQTAVAP